MHSSKKGWLTQPSGELASTESVHQEGEVQNDDGEEQGRLQKTG